MTCCPSGCYLRPDGPLWYNTMVQSPAHCSGASKCVCITTPTSSGKRNTKDNSTQPEIIVCKTQSSKTQAGPCRLVQQLQEQISPNHVWGLIILLTISALKNTGKSCWVECGAKEGPCYWCGTEGLCCRKGRTGNGCSGIMGVDGMHVCVREEVVGKFIYKAPEAHCLRSVYTQASKFKKIFFQFLTFLAHINLDIIL